jgi:hypothetical protein
MKPISSKYLMAVWLLFTSILLLQKVAHTEDSIPQKEPFIVSANLSESLPSKLAVEASSTSKYWPKPPLRGINTKLVFHAGPKGSEHISFLTDDIFKKFANWKINLIRTTIDVDYNSKWLIKKGSTMVIPASYDLEDAYKDHFYGLEQALRLAKNYNIFIVLSANNIVGRKIDVMYKKENSRNYGKDLSALWIYVAKRFGKHPNLLAYDLMNEPPLNVKKGRVSWHKTILPDLIGQIRAIDKETYFVVEPGPWGLPSGFKYLKPLKDQKTIYSFHFYFPHSYTHQGVRNNRKNMQYPGKLREWGHSPLLYWNRTQLKESVKIAKNFQNRYGARMFIGEFSVIRWAPGAAKWLEDAISIFEEFGWDWAYHSYGGWNGWNPTYMPDDPKSERIDGGKISEPLKVLKNAWNKNQF